MGPVEGQGIRIEDLPDEMMVQIFSILKKTEKMKVSMVNRRWFRIANNEILNLAIKWPQEKNQDFENLIVRFKRLKNLELEVKLSRIHKDLTVLESLDLMLPIEFDGTLELDINEDLIQTKNPENTYIQVNLFQKHYPTI